MIDTATPPTATFPQVPSWRELYKAALFEPDRKKLPSRIDDAERAIIARARELFAATTDTIEEDQALDDALYALKALHSCLGLEDNHARRFILSAVVQWSAFGFRHCEPEFFAASSAQIESLTQPESGLLTSTALGILRR
jgi:hypothetical protein